jgi:hypothetical protein
MIDEYDKNAQYTDVLNRMQRKTASDEGFYLMVKNYFTNNIFYYFLCVFFRLNSLLLISNKYTDLFDIYSDYNSKLYKKVLGTLSLYNIIKYFHFTFKTYIHFNFIIYLSFIVRFIIYMHIRNKMKNYKNTNKWPIPSSYRIISDHIQFIMFPFIIEYLSFCHYIYFFPDTFIIRVNKEQKSLLFVIMIINSILIIFYNNVNILFLMCINKIYTTSLFDAYSRISDNKTKYKKHITFRCSDFVFYLFVILQNLVLILHIDICINKYLHRIIFKIVFLIIILSIIFFFFFSRINDYKLSNFMNYLINMILLFCFYSIILDFILIIAKYRIKTRIFEIIYILIKIFFSFMTYYLYLVGTNNFLKEGIINIFFQEKNNNQKDIYFVNSFYFLNEIMIKMKENNDFFYTNILVELLSDHINNCQKIVCNCKLIENLLKKVNPDKDNIEKLKDFISELLIIVNYLYESAFIEYDYFNNTELAIILAEHFCHLKDNPTIAFSIINTLIQKHRDKLTKFKRITLYELSQKYLYHIAAEIKRKINLEIVFNERDSLRRTHRVDYFKSYFNNLIMSTKLKKSIFDYTDNIIKILRYKNLFEDSLSFKYDESDENMISFNIDFLDEYYVFNQEGKSKTLINNENKNNLYNIIYLLKKEKVFYQDFINSTNKFEIIKDIPIFIIFKFYLYYDLFEGGKIPDKIAQKLFNLLSKRIKIYNNKITKDEYAILKDLYYKQNNASNSKYFSIFEFKKELITKYFSEDCSLKLGFKQKDIIKKPLDILLPKDFSESHRNIIKDKIFGNQNKYFLYNSYFFNANLTILYPIKFESLLIYNISKNFNLITEFTFVVI